MSYRHREVRKDFSGGLNVRDNESVLANTESPEMNNVLVGKRGGFYSRPDARPIIADQVAPGYPVTSLFEYIDPDRTIHLFATAGDRLVKQGIDWEVIEDGFTERSYFEFINHPYSNRALFVNGHDGYWETDGYTAQLVDLYEPTPDELIEIGDAVIPRNPKLIAFWDRRVWLANTDDYPDRVYLNVDDINGNSMHGYFTAWSWIRATNIKGEGITAFKVYKNALVVFTRSSIRVISQAEDLGVQNTGYQVTEISNTVGTVSQRSVQQVSDYLVFLAQDGVYIFDGQTAPYKVSQRVEPLFDEMSLTWRDRAAAALYGDQYFLSFAKETENDMTLVYDTDIIPVQYIGERYALANSPWVVFDGFSPWQWSYSHDFKLRFADNDGYVYEYDVVNEEAEMDAYYITQVIDLDVPDMKKRIRWIDIDCDAQENSFLKIEYRLDDDEDWELLGVINQEIKSYRFVDFKQYKPLCRKIQLKFSNGFTGCVFRVNRFALDIAIRGQQKEMRSYGDKS